MNNYRYGCYIKVPEVNVYERVQDKKPVDTVIFGDEIGIRYDKTYDEHLSIIYKKNGKDKQGFIQRSWFINEKEILIYKKIQDKKPVDTVIFGDEIGIRYDKTYDEHLSIIYKKNGKRKHGLIKQSSIITQNRMLELYFIDVGQGDSILLHTPHDKKLLIDGGPDNSMYKFLRSKYGRRSLVEFDSIIMTHADNDHMKGLIRVIDDNKIRISKFFHNGIPKLKDKQGEYIVKGENGKRKLLGLFDDVINFQYSPESLQDGFRKLIRGLQKRRRYSKIICKRIDQAYEDLRVDKIESESPDHLRIKVLGPINLNPIPQNENENKKTNIVVDTEPAYRCIQSEEKIDLIPETLNGNSISLLIEYHDCRILLCGDMNEDFEKEFICIYGEGLQAHIFKANHHGSQHFFYKFLEKVSPSISVVSAGFAYNYGHPRAILLGSLGRYSFNETEEPLLFITKISGTYRRYDFKQMKSDAKFVLNEIREKIKNFDLKEKFEEISNWFNKKEREIGSYYSNLPNNVYSKSKDGSIYVRTDGKQVVAGRIISITETQKPRWETYLYEIVGKKLVKHS